MIKYYHQKTGSDCFRTCLASLLDLEPSQVPDFYGSQYVNKESAWSRLCDWLISEFQINANYRTDRPPKYWSIAVGTSNIDGLTKHSVLVCDGEFAHDPWPSGDGLCDVDGWIYLTDARQHRR